MLFERSSALPPDYQQFARKIADVEKRIWALFPKRVYTVEELFGPGQSSDPGSLPLLRVLIDIGLLERQHVSYDPESGFKASDEFDLDRTDYLDDVRYVLIAKPMKLINDFNESPMALPYFISFHSDGALESAELIHETLKLAGLTGFISSELGSGADWRDQATRALRDARSLIIVESEKYHLRPRCIIERDFGSSNGAHILRVGVCERADLAQCPDWFNEACQHVNFRSGGAIDLMKLLASGLQPPLGLAGRRRAALELVRKLTFPLANSLANVLNLTGQLTGSDMERRDGIVLASFTNDVSANRFCQEYDLSAVF